MHPHKAAGASRLLSAARHSCRGFTDTWCTEAAFRQEAMFAVPVCAVVFVLDIDPLWRILLLLTLGLVLVVELLNTAIEAAIDRIGLDRHPLSGKAKDAGSAAVAGGLLLHGAVWVCLPW
ncbi:MAG: diacylglycerol kinase [Luteimonas sp.]|nr:diacylglycerol kinase [Luteimonas sp.]